MIIDYLVYLSYRFVSSFPKINNAKKLIRSIRGAFVLVYTVVGFIISSIYMVLIKMKLLVFNKWAYLLVCIFMFCTIWIGLIFRYKKRIRFVLKRYGLLFPYSKSKVTFLYLLFWILSTLLLWGGLLLVKSFLWEK